MHNANSIGSACAFTQCAPHTHTHPQTNTNVSTRLVYTYAMDGYDPNNLDKGQGSYNYNYPPPPAYNYAQQPSQGNIPQNSLQYPSYGQQVYSIRTYGTTAIFMLLQKKRKAVVTG